MSTISTDTASTPPSSADTTTSTSPTTTDTTTSTPPSSTDTTTSTSPSSIVKMFGVCHSAYGAPRDVLQLSHELIKPIISSSKQVLIRVHAVGINPVDYKILSGALSAIIKRKFPATPGLDLSGVVVAVGTGCKRIKVGDEVYADLGKNCGAYAEYAVANESCVALKPTNLTFGEAASVPVAGLTSYQALYKHGALTAGQKVLILGGAGGTGSYAIQLAKHRRAHVTVTCSARNAALCQHLGADRVIDYSKSQWWTTLAPNSIDIVYDCVGEPDAWLHAKQVMVKGGIFITITGDNPNEPFSVGRMLGTVAAVVGRKVASIVTKHRYHWFFTSEDHSDLSDLKSLFEANSIRPVIEKYYTIEGNTDQKADEKDGVVEMFEHIISGRARGKLALEIHQAGERKVFDFESLPAYVEPPVEEKESKQESKPSEPLAEEKEVKQGESATSSTAKAGTAESANAEVAAPVTSSE